MNYPLKTTKSFTALYFFDIIVLLKCLAKRTRILVVQGCGHCKIQKSIRGMIPYAPPILYKEAPASFFICEVNMQSLKVLKGRYLDRPITAKEAQQNRDELKAMVLKNGAAKKD